MTREDAFMALTIQSDNFRLTMSLLGDNITVTIYPLC
jgi:hypothetical protein